METVTTWISHTGWAIFLTAGICFGVYMVIRRLAPLTIRRTVRRQMKKKPKAEREKRVQTLVRLITTVSAIGLGILATFLVLQQLRINITTPLVGLGVFGVAIGFGAQYLIRDLIAGFFVYLENQYNVGDVIRMGDVAGIVEELSLRRTVLRDLDGARHMIANGEIRIVSNLTQEWSRAHLNISVAYKEDLDRVMALMRKTWEEMKQDPNWGSDMLSETPWLLRVDEFGDSGITIKMVGETRPIKQWDLMGEFRRRIKKVFDEQGIEIPWPHTKVYFGSPPNSSKLDSK
ncbi:MAG: mechanosensitive ion channel family protein [Dehalococcoidia bacterium]|nr:MAG: mechanosensitive ion channel family protein [Dehalococcoidia bacterium]